PRARNSSATRAAAGAFTSSTATLAPASASAMATPRPIPEAPPVTTAVRPSSVVDAIRSLLARCLGRRRRHERVASEADALDQQARPGEGGVPALGHRVAPVALVEPRGEER